METNQIIKFSKNWNNKLNCPVHTTIRAYEPSKYVVGQEYKEYLACKKDDAGAINLNGKYFLHINTVKCIDLKCIQLKDISTSMAWIDAAVPLEYLLGMFRTMYKAQYEQANGHMYMHWLLLKNINHQPTQTQNGTN